MGWMKFNFPSNSECHSSILYSPKTQNGMDEIQLSFELRMSLIHLFLPENSKWDGCNSTFLRTQSVTHTSFIPRKLKWMKFNFPSNSKGHSYIFNSPKTQNGMDEIQLAFELRMSVIHLLLPENSK